MKRRGLSPVVATIAIILVTIGAVSFIAGFLVPWFQNQTKEGTECIDYQEYFTFDDSFGFNCYELDGTYLTGISVRGKSAPGRVVDGIKGFQLLFYEGASSNNILVENGKSPAFNTGGLKIWNSTKDLEIPEGGGVRTYVYNSTDRVGRIEVFPMLKDGDRLCDKSDEIEINNPCSPIGLLK